MKKPQLILVLIAVFVLGIIFLKASKYEPKVPMWAETDIPCLPGGHANALLHIHADLQILVDGASEEISANIGVNETCMAEVHTHDATGKIHIETVDPEKTYALTDFFKVYGKEIERAGYSLRITLNGEEADSSGDLKLLDGDQIVVSYSKIVAPNTSATEDKSTSTAGDGTSFTGATVSAKIGETITLSGVTGTVMDLVEDSRCPEGAQCIQAGTVRVKVNFAYNLLSQSVTLTLNETFSMYGRSITLVSVKPSKPVSGTIAKSEYVFGFEIK